MGTYTAVYITQYALMILCTLVTYLSTGNMLALVDDGKQPQRISLKRALEIFIKFRYVSV